jgi:hypothetical protein
MIRIYLCRGRITLMKRIRKGASMNFYDLAIFCQFLEVPPDCIVRHINGLTEVRTQYFVVQVYLV